MKSSRYGFLLAFVLLAGCVQRSAPPPMEVPSGPPLFSASSSGRNQPPPARGGGSFGKPAKTGTPASVTSDQMHLGNPDSATELASNTEHFLMVRPQLALSYNNTTRTPNWVSWKLTASDIGDTERGSFKPDPDLPADFVRVSPSDYTRSGYDRGHNCPSKDRSDTRENNDAVFYMTNMTPQFHEMNAGPWEDLERYSRTLAQQGNTLYIVAGHGGEREKLASGVVAPAFAWKVVVVVPAGSEPTAESRVIAVKMPNERDVAGHPWSDYIVTPAEIEAATNLTFFNALPSDLAEALRQKRDLGEGSVGKGTSGFSKTKRRNSGGSFGGGSRR